MMIWWFSDDDMWTPWRNQHGVTQVTWHGVESAKSGPCKCDPFSSRLDEFWSKFPTFSRLIKAKLCSCFRSHPHWRLEGILNYIETILCYAKTTLTCVTVDTCLRVGLFLRYTTPPQDSTISWSSGGEGYTPGVIKKIIPCKMRQRSQCNAHVGDGRTSVTLKVRNELIWVTV